MLATLSWAAAVLPHLISACTHSTAAGKKEEHGNLSSRQITSQPGADDFFYWMSLLCCCVEEGYGIFVVVVVVTTRSMLSIFHPSTTHNTLVKSDGEMVEYEEGCRYGRGFCVRRGHVGMD